MKKATTDKELLERLKAKAPEVLEAEIDFDEKIIRALRIQRTRDKPVAILRKPRRAKSKKK